MLLRCFALSPRSRLLAESRQLVCDHPLQSLRLEQGTWEVLQALRPGVPIQEYLTGLSPGWIGFLERLTGLGFLQADYRITPAETPELLDVIIPAYGNAAGLSCCLAALAVQSYPMEALRVSVVDDASPRPLHEQLAGKDFGSLQVRWLRTPHNQGPASARNLAATRPWREEELRPAPWLVFVDSDCVPNPHWAASLAALLESPELSAVGGGVLPQHTTSLLARYEGAFSSLVLGSVPGAAGGIESRLPYLPSCNLAVRRNVFEQVGGFREGWRFGEDVDLSWRLAAEEYLLFYHPAPRVTHQFRDRWGPFLQRRRLYARSEAPLRAHHPKRFALPWVMSHWPVLIAAGAAPWAGWPTGTLAALMVLAAQALAPHWRRGGTHWPLRVRLPAVGRSLASLALHHGRRATRLTLIGWPPLLLMWPNLWPLALALFALGAAGEWISRRQDASPVDFPPGFTGDALAYSLGWVEGRVGYWLGKRNACFRRRFIP